MKFSIKKDVEGGLKYYPSLHLSYNDGKPLVEGSFTARKGAIEIEDYEVSISFPPKYPYDFPSVIETSKKIPRTPNRHVFSDSALCFGNSQDVWRVCKNGITFKWFLDNILNNHLCREYVKEETGDYPTGERSHGIEGIWEGYYEIFETSDKSFILHELNLMLSYTLYPKNRECFCRSGKKYKRCHELKEQQIFDIGRHKVMSLYRLLKNDYSTKTTIAS